jgi:hypothetical protein
LTDAPVLSFSEMTCTEIEYFEDDRNPEGQLHLPGRELVGQIARVHLGNRGVPGDAERP